MSAEASSYAAALFHVACSLACLVWLAVAVALYAAVRLSAHHSRRGQ